MLDNISKYIENNNIDPKSFTNDTTEIISVLEMHNHFSTEIVKEIINTANIKVSPDLYAENMTEPKQKEESVTNDSEFSPGQYLPRINVPKDIEDDNEFSM